MQSYRNLNGLFRHSQLVKELGISLLSVQFLNICDIPFKARETLQKRRGKEHESYRVGRTALCSVLGLLHGHANMGMQQLWIPVYYQPFNILSQMRENAGMFTPSFTDNGFWEREHYMGMV